MAHSRFCRELKTCLVIFFISVIIILVVFNRLLSGAKGMKMEVRKLFLFALLSCSFMCDHGAISILWPTASAMCHKLARFVRVFERRQYISAAIMGGYVSLLSFLNWREHHSSTPAIRWLSEGVLLRDIVLPITHCYGCCLDQRREHFYSQLPNYIEGIIENVRETGSLEIPGQYLSGLTQAQLQKLLNKIKNIHFIRQVRLGCYWPNKSVLDFCINVLNSVPQTRNLILDFVGLDDREMLKLIDSIKSLNLLEKLDLYDCRLGAKLNLFADILRCARIHSINLAYNGIDTMPDDEFARFAELFKLSRILFVTLDPYALERLKPVFKYMSCVKIITVTGNVNVMDIGHLSGVVKQLFLERPDIVVKIDGSPSAQQVDSLCWHYGFKVEKQFNAVVLRSR